MTKTKTKLILLLALMLAFSIAFCACNKKDPNEGNETAVKLAAPQNLRVEDKTLIWDSVENAAGYTIYFNNQKRQTTESSYDLSELTKDATYTIQVKALGDGKGYADSEWVLFSYTVSEPESEPVSEPVDEIVEVEYDEKGFKYRLLEDKTGYEVSKGKINVISKTEIIIPDEFRGLPVKRIADYGFVTYEASGDQLFMFPDSLTGKLCNPTTKTIHLPEKLESIGKTAFAGSTGIEEIIIPDTVSNIGEYAFAHCKNLKKVKLSSTLRVIGGGCFEFCALTDISLPDTLEIIGKYAFSARFKSGMFPVYSEQNFTKLVFPSSIKQIGSCAFRGCRELKEIILPSDADLTLFGDTVFEDTKWYNEQSNGLVYLGNILYGYKGQLPNNSAIQIPETVKYIAGRAFDKQNNLKSIYIPDGVKLIGDGLFMECISLSEVRLPSDLITIPDNTFYRCESITEIEIPKGVIEIGNYCFAICKGLKKIVLPNKVETIGNYSFTICSSLEEIVIPENVKYIGDGAFNACSQLKKIVLPAGLKTLGKSAFSGCSQLERIVLPDGLKTLSESAFSGCSQLKEVIIPKSVETLGVSLFKSCSSLTAIYYEGAAAEWETLITKYSYLTIALQKSTTIYCYSETKPTGSGNYWHYVDGKAVIWD